MSGKVWFFLTAAPLVVACTGGGDVVRADARVQPGIADARPAADAKVAPDAKLVADAAIKPDAGFPDAPVIVETPDAMEPPPADRAVLLINEVAPAIVGKHDLIELLVTRGGTTKDIVLSQNYVTPTDLSVLPDVAVQEGDLIVVHMQPQAAMAETLSIAECPRATPGCEENYDDAWDFVASVDTADIGWSYRVLVLRTPEGEVMDAVPFMRYAYAQTKPGAYEGDLPQLIADGHWAETCAEPCDYTAVTNMEAASVSWTDLGDGAAGATVARKPGGANDHRLSDWQPIPTTDPLNTLGAPN
jgi:hypothetical protein